MNDYFLSVHTVWSCHHCGQGSRILGHASNPNGPKFLATSRPKLVGFMYSSSDPYSVHLDSLTLKIYMIVLWGICSVVRMMRRPESGALVVLIPCSPVAWSGFYGRRYTWFLSSSQVDTFLFFFVLVQALAVGYPWAMRLLA